MVINFMKMTARVLIRYFSLSLQYLKHVIRGRPRAGFSAEAEAEENTVS